MNAHFSSLCQSRANIGIVCQNVETSRHFNARVHLSQRTKEFNHQWIENNQPIHKISCAILKTKTLKNSSIITQATATESPELKERSTKDIISDSSVRPERGEVVQSAVAIADSGTLATVTADGWPVGTCMRYVIDPKGNPVMKLRSSALHTRNLQRDSRCSLHVRLSGNSETFTARCTLVGRTSSLDESKESLQLIGQYAEKYGADVGIDALAADDTYARLTVEKVLYVAGIGQDKQAELVTAEEYLNSEADPICQMAPQIVRDMNSQRKGDLIRLCTVFGGLERVESAQMIWADKFGIDMRATCEGGVLKNVRLSFIREIHDEREARSALTVLGQYAWELEKQYNPIVLYPEIEEDDEE
mmetsp:Transcript_26314/g.36358  ORF Transcript_26314/g.36358 Transcript_26314/m.36358 type:complete len:361 (+) Transcript_26314:106-1188(+)|eukprot:CAMPEP_0196581002 /NCGR_PEP_ID=MMETSP1081-20130531/31903_1 /TAXON_ID=36882 /ORGANISM="Pyramimonas amylifera, Strain CCMP720" /LENGTH=360 /DNA_ID=CAMNT_0041901077 /DNA_START=98 /DNA_END=1180 /DNA_ORIENTATION=+